MGSCSPISPVEHTTTSPAPMPSSPATSSAVVCVFWKPSGPVHAFAPPEFRTTARTDPARTTSRDQCTGAAATRLEVNWAAAANSGPVLTTSARSGPPEALKPASTPEAVKPAAVHTPDSVVTGISGTGSWDVMGVSAPVRSEGWAAAEPVTGPSPER